MAVIRNPLTGDHLVNTFTAFYETRRFISCSHKSATASYPQPQQSRPRLLKLLLEHAF
jgi:hypothetical protein